MAGHRPLVLALAMASCFAAGPVLAQPSGAHAIHGGAVLTQNGSSLTVTTTNGPGSNHSAINWQSFGVPVGSTTWFAQPGAGSTSINRVVGPDPSAIMGTLGSNGRLVLVNPAGIAVGAGALVDTAGFTASTLRMSDADAIAGRLRFANDGRAGPLSVQGQVIARSGDVVLLAPNIEVGKDAIVESHDGATILAAGQAVEITGRGLEGILLEVQAPADQAVNLGTLKGDAVGIFAGTLRHSGLVQARTATAEGGRVVLLAQAIDIADQGTIDASGLHGGGTVLIGGERQGAVALAGFENARDVHLAAGAVVRADALATGDGGRVIVWGSETAEVHGLISARGGPEGGNGGFVETSARQLVVTRAPDLRAAAGRSGKWLIDPEDLDIDEGESENVGGDGHSHHPGSVEGSGKIAVGVIRAALNDGTDVEVDTVSTHGSHGTIRLKTPLLKTYGGNATLTLRAHNDILLDALIGSTSGKLNLVLHANSDNTGGGGTTMNAGIDTNGGTVTMVGTAPLTIGNVAISGTLFADNATIPNGLTGGNLTIATGIVEWWGGSTWRNGTTTVGPDATLRLVGEGNHQLLGYTLENQGTIGYQASEPGTLMVDASSVLRNMSGAVIDFRRDGGIGNSDGACTSSSLFVNRGKVQRSGESSGTSFIGGTRLLYDGFDETIDAGNGTIDFTSTASGHLHNGRVTLIGDVGFAAGNHRFENEAVIEGTLNLRGAAAQFGDVKLGAVTNLDAGSIHIDDGRTLTVASGGIFNWKGSTSIVGGTLRVEHAATLNVNDVGDHGMWENTLNNAGTVNVNSGAGPVIIDGNSVINNLAGATFAFRGDGLVSANSSCDPCAFNNDGKLLKTGGGYISSLSGTNLVVTLGATSVVRVKHGVLLIDAPLLNPGTIDVRANAVLATGENSITNTATGVIRGAGVLQTASLQNDGTVTPGDSSGPGFLGVSGNYSQGGTGKLQVRIASPGHSSALLVGGDVALAGLVEAVAASESGIALGDTFEVVLAAGNVSGSVAATPATDWSTRVLPNRLQLAAGAAPGPTSSPPPPTSAPPPATTAPTAGPSPAPTPAPPPTSQAAAIVIALDGQVTVAEAQQSVTVMGGTVTQALDTPPDPAKQRDRSRPSDDGKTCR